MFLRTLLPLCAAAALPAATDLSSPNDIAAQLQARYRDGRQAAIDAIDDLPDAGQEPFAQARSSTTERNGWPSEQASLRSL